MNIRRKYFLVFVFLALGVFSPNVSAGDYARLNFIGFSANGKYLAYEEYGTQDGSGFPYSNVYLLETAKNSFVVPPVKVRIDDESKSERAARLKSKTSAAANLRKFKIVAGNTGELLVARLITDLDVSEDAERKRQVVNFTDFRTSNYFSDEYELILKTSEIKTKTCDYTEKPPLKFDLTLKNTRRENSVEKILQSDQTLPESRGCPLAYAVQNVYVYKNQIAVFIQVYTTGFEGPDMRFLAVTGIYK